MTTNSILTDDEEAALDKAVNDFGKRNYALGNRRKRPQGMSIFDWLSSEPNAEAFKKGQEIMKSLGESNA
jgi:hypothetical protein